MSELVDALKGWWTLLKLLWLYIGYWLVGLPQEYFCIKKANYFVDLTWYDLAIRNYRKALQDTDDPHVQSMLGYCYSKIGSFEDSVERYRKAHAKIRDPKIHIGLAISEFESGNIEKSEAIMDEVRRSDYRLDSRDVEALDWLGTRIQMAKRGRKDLSHKPDTLK